MSRTRAAAALNAANMARINRPSAAQMVAAAERTTETTVEQWASNLVQTVAETTPEAITVIRTAPQAGELIRHKDGTDYTFVSLSKDGLCYRVKDSNGKASYKRIAAFI